MNLRLKKSSGSTSSGYRRLLVLMLLLSGGSYFSNLNVLGAEPSASVILAKAADNSGGLVIKTAEIYFSALIADAPPTEAHIEEAVAIQEAALRDSMIEHRGKNPKLSRVYEKAIEGNRENVTKQVIANAKRVLNGVYFIGGPHIGGDRLAEFRIKRGAEVQAGDPLTLLYRRHDHSRQTSFFFDMKARTAVASANSVSAGIPEPHVLGRLQGSVLSTIFGRTEYSQGSGVIIGGDAVPKAKIELDESQSPDKKDGVGVIVFVERSGQWDRLARIVIDESRDFVCPLIEEFDETGQVIRAWQNLDYFRDSESGVWFPSKCKYRYSIPSRPGEIGTIDYDIDQQKSRFNRNLSVDRFSLSVPVGATLIRQLGGDEKKWKVKCEFVATIDRIESLVNDPCLVGVEPVNPVAVSDDVLGPNTSRVPWLLTANILVITSIAVFLIYRRFKRRASHCWLFLVLTISGGLCGCSVVASSDHNSHNGNKLLCYAEPVSVDLGTISAIGQVVESTATFVNGSERQAIRVAFSSGCGCTALSRSKVVVEPQSKVTIPFSVATYGQRVDFQTEITASWGNMDGSISGVVAVPVKAKFIQTVFATPSRVFLQGASGNQLEGEVTITAPDELWSKLEVVASLPGIAVSKAPSDDLGNNNRRFCVVVADRGANITGLSIVVKVAEQDTPVMSIPVLTGSGKIISGQ